MEVELTAGFDGIIRGGVLDWQIFNLEKRSTEKGWRSGVVAHAGNPSYCGG